MRKFMRLLHTRFFLCAVLIVLEFLLLTSLVSFLNSLFMPLSILGWAIHIAALLYLINRDETPEFKLPWMMLLLLVPFLGTLTFIVLTRDNMSKHSVRRADAVRRSLAPYHAQQDALLSELRSADPDAHAQAVFLYNTTRMPVCRSASAAYYPSGEAFFDALLCDLQHAERFIFLEYFILEGGTMWDAIHAVLREKAQSGVQVYLMYDDFGCMTTLPQHYYRQLNAEGIHCRPSNRFRPILSHIHNNRDHRKITVIDGRIGYTGGINLADEYINAVTRFGHWKDTAVRLEGAAAQSLALLFLGIWNTQSPEPLRPEDYLAPNAAENGSGYVIPFGDCPAPLDDHDIGKGVYLNMINTAKHCLYITTPYLVCDHELLSALRRAALRGVDVRLITPHIPDKKTVFWMTRSNYAPLLRDGVRIFEYTPGFIHAKNFLADGKFAVCGTINLDYRSLMHHFECGAWMYNVPCIQAMREDFLATQAQSMPVDAAAPLLNPLQQFCARVMRVFSPLF